jgi:hypothetical protein
MDVPAASAAKTMSKNNLAKHELLREKTEKSRRYL